MVSCHSGFCTRNLRVGSLVQVRGKTIWLHSNKYERRIAHFTVTVGNEAGVDLVLIQPCLLYYVNHVFVILNSIF